MPIEKVNELTTTRMFTGLGSYKLNQSCHVYLVKISILALIEGLALPGRGCTIQISKADAEVSKTSKSAFEYATNLPGSI